MRSNTHFTKRALLSLMLVIAMLFGMSACGGGYKNPDDQLHKMEAAWFSDHADEILSVYADARDQLSEAKQAAKGTVTFTVGDPLINLLRSQIPYDLSFIKDVSFDIESAIQDTKTLTSLALKLAGTKLVSVDLFADASAGTAAISLGDLADNWLSINADDMDIDYDEGFSDIISIFMDAADKLPTKKVLSSILNHYYGIFLENINGVVKAEGTLTADGIAVECTTLTVNITERMLYEATKDVLTAVIADKDIKEIFTSLNKAVGSTLYENLGVSLDVAYSSMIDSASYALENMNSADVANYITDDVLFTVVDYVKGDEIIGRSISSPNADEFALFYGKASTKDGNGYELTANIDYTTIKIKGEGTEKKGALTGEFDLIIDGTAFAFIKLEGFNVDALLDGTPKGTITVSPGAGLWDAISGSSDSSVTSILGSAFALRAQFDCSDDEAKISLDVLNGSDVYVGIKIDASKEKAGKISAPKKVTDDAEAWASTINVSKLISNIEKTKYVSDINDILEGTLGVTLDDIKSFFEGNN